MDLQSRLDASEQAREALQKALDKSNEHLRTLRLRYDGMVHERDLALGVAQDAQRRESEMQAELLRIKELLPLSLLDLPALALSAIHDALWECDAEGFCTSARDAAAFRSTCKRVCDAAQLPSMLKVRCKPRMQRKSEQPACTSMVAFDLREILKIIPGLSNELFPYMAHTQLSFTDPVPDLSSLKLLLTKPTAAGTLLSLRVVQPDKGYFQRYKEADIMPPLFSNLSRLGSHLIDLQMPCCTIGICLVFVCEHLIHLQHLTLHLQGGECEAEEMQDFRGHGLRSLTLSVPPCSSSFYFDAVLDLTAFGELRDVHLQGPIVKLTKGHSFILPPHTRVIIDPGLRGRKPTPWARRITSYEYSVMPLSAIPDDREYRDEDHNSREARLEAFREEVIGQAMDMAGGPDIVSLEHEVDAERELKSQAFCQRLEVLGLYYRSDLLSVDGDFIASTAEEIFDDYFANDMPRELWE